MNGDRPEWLTDELITVLNKYDVEIFGVQKDDILQVNCSKELSSMTKIEIMKFLPKKSFFKFCVSIKMSALSGIAQILLENEAICMPKILENTLELYVFSKSLETKLLDIEHETWNKVHYILKMDGFIKKLKVILNGQSLFDKNISDETQPLESHDSVNEFLETPITQQEVKKPVESKTVSKEDEINQKIFNGILNECNSVDDFLTKF